MEQEQINGVHKFKEGEMVEKIDTRPGHRYIATIVSCFFTLNGKAKYVLEQKSGSLHIVSGTTLNPPPSIINETQ